MWKNAKVGLDELMSQQHVYTQDIADLDEEFRENNMDLLGTRVCVYMCDC